MARRGQIAALALFYALQASWVLYAGVDALAPMIAASAVPAPSVARPAGDPGCCAASCGCPTEARARKACCCDPKAAKAPVPASGRTSAIEAARCAGVEAAMAQARTQPVLPLVPSLAFIPLVEAAPALPDLAPASPTDADALDKVPIL
jgi:hypothetical protein